MTGPRIEERVRVVARRSSPRVRDIKRFLVVERVPYLWLDLEEDEVAARLVAELGRGDAELPLVLLPDGVVLSRPDDATLRTALGIPLRTNGERPYYDLVVVGGGPAGLSAAVYAATEGMSTVVIEAAEPGGQAGHSASIENYLGFPEGLTGADLAMRALAQVERLGVEVVAGRRAVALRAEGDLRLVTLDDDAALGCHTVLLAPGLAFEWLDVPGFARLVGEGIWYGATTVDAASLAGRDVFVLGGGPQVASAVLALAEHARVTHLLLPDASLDDAVGGYFADRLRETPRVEVHGHATVAAAEGETHLEGLTLRYTDPSTSSGQAAEGRESTRDVPATDLLLFSGATPRTEWLAETIRLDEHGFVLTGRRAFGRRNERGPAWTESRDPYLLETSCPGVFAAGDVRHGSVKRLASAIGEGAMAVQFIQEYRKER